jgi:hypothetical protein
LFLRLKTFGTAAKCTHFAAVLLFCAAAAQKIWYNRTGLSEKTGGAEFYVE